MVPANQCTIMIFHYYSHTIMKIKVLNVCNMGLACFSVQRNTEEREGKIQSRNSRQAITADRNPQNLWNVINYIIMVYP